MAQERHKRGEAEVKTRIQNLHRKARQMALSFARGEDGAEVIEYAIVLGLLIVGTIVTLMGFGVKLVARWTSINNSM